MDNIKNLFGNGAKAVQYNLQHVQLRLKSLQVSTKEVSAAVENLKDALPEIQAVGDDLKKETQKLEFKNKPHLARIDEAKKRIDDNLETINHTLSFKRKNKKNKA
ncbi:hypothetical protein [Weissella uvarum]|nr:hypothetical protein [Weissella uvarum]